MSQGVISESYSGFENLNMHSNVHTACPRERTVYFDLSSKQESWA